ncbi:MAG: hypothetical protein J0L75_04955 [Spirochaetes bacterium]|nr:hypothetical protein [Spirochaetota bacterium]
MVHPFGRARDGQNHRRHRQGHRPTFTAAAILAALALRFSIYVYFQFNQLGGTKHEVAPLEAEIEPEEG